MWRRKLGQLACLLVAGCFFSNLAWAQGVRIFATASGSYLYNENLFNISGDKYQSNYAPGGMVTVGAEYTPGTILGFEGAYGYGRNNLRITNLQATPSTETGFGVRVQRFSGNLVLHSPIALIGLRPYITGGLEYDHFAPTSAAKAQAYAEGFAGQSAVLGAANKIGVNAGGGVEWSILPLIGLRFDLRDHITGTPTYGLPQESTTSAIFPVSGKANKFEFSAGIVLHVGH